MTNLLEEADGGSGGVVLAPVASHPQLLLLDLQDYNFGIDSIIIMLHFFLVLNSKLTINCLNIPPRQLSFLCQNHHLACPGQSIMQAI